MNITHKDRVLNELTSAIETETNIAEKRLTAEVVLNNTARDSVWDWEAPKKWYDISLQDLSLFMLKLTVASLPSVALAFVAYVLFLVVCAAALQLLQ
jgi:hypothetical protein